MMRELSDNIMDIAQNSISAGAILTEVHVKISHADNMITFVFKDDGCGMSEELVKSVIEPFTTTRKTRKVGLGLPLLKQTAEMTGGAMDIQSTVGVGTTVTATFGLDHIDRPPMGDVAGAKRSETLVKSIFSGTFHCLPASARRSGRTSATAAISMPF